MGKILVTGATGQLGGRTIEQLLKRAPAADVVALARDPARLGDLAGKGVEVRAGDYLDYDGLLRAFEDVEKVMLVSAPAFTDRMTQHYNVITAARQAGVRRIVYTAIMRRRGSHRVISHVTESDIFTEQTLAASGVPWTVAIQPAFLDGLLTHMIVVALHDGPRRFSELKRDVGDISQQMLTSTLKTLERDGMASRTVRATAPPQVSYALNGLGRSLADTLRPPAAWSIDNLAEIQASRVRYDGQHSSS